MMHPAESGRHEERCVMKNLMEYRGYHARVEYSAEDGCLVGRVLGVADTLVFDGESVPELKEMFHACVDDYLELCRELGREPDKEYKGSFNVRVTPEQHRRAVLAAERQGISLNQYVSQALDAYEQGGTGIREIRYVVPVSMKEWRAPVEPLDAGEFGCTLPERYASKQMGGYTVGWN